MSLTLRIPPTFIVLLYTGSFKKIAVLHKWDQAEVFGLEQYMTAVFIVMYCTVYYIFIFAY